MSSGYISFSSSTVLLRPPYQIWKFFTAQFVFHFVLMGGFGFVASQVSFVLALLKRFESLATDRDSLFVFTAFALFSFSKLLSLSLHSSKAIDGNCFREMQQLASHLQYHFKLDSVQPQVASQLDKTELSPACHLPKKRNYLTSSSVRNMMQKRFPMTLHSNHAEV